MKVVGKVCLDNNYSFFIPNNAKLPKMIPEFTEDVLKN